MYWVNKSDFEVSGLGTVVVKPDGILHVTGACLLPQVNGPTHTDIEPEDVGKLMHEFHKAKVEGDLRFWWHSHVDMSVFWSGTDMGTIKKIGAGGWFLSTVFNKKRELRSAYYGVEGQVTPFGRTPLFLDELNTTVEPFQEENAAEWGEDYARNVTIKTYQAHQWDGYNVEDYAVLPDKKPKGMPKKVWRGLRRKTAELPPNSPTRFPAIVAPDTTDEYGFTQDERSYFAGQGWDQGDFDLLSEEDVTPSEMLELAYAGIEPSDALECLERGWNATDIVTHYNHNAALGMSSDDVPVFDNTQGSKYDDSPSA